MNNTFRIVAVAVIAVYILLTLYHLSQGFGFGDALKGGFLDVRAVFVCWGNWGEMGEFVARPALAGRDIGGMALDMGMCQ